MNPSFRQDFLSQRHRSSPTSGVYCYSREAGPTTVSLRNDGPWINWGEIYLSAQLSPTDAWSLLSSAWETCKTLDEKEWGPTHTADYPRLTSK